MAAAGQTAIRTPSHPFRRVSLIMDDAHSNNSIVSPSNTNKRKRKAGTSSSRTVQKMNRLRTSSLIPSRSSYFPPAKRSKATLDLPTSSTTTDTVTRSLDVICTPSSHPHTLVLGTHPGKVSLNWASKKKGAALEKFIRKRGGNGPQNYGNPANSFWNIAGSFLNYRRDQIKYEEQTTIWKDNSLALWDVIRSCSYKDDSSLDSKINMNTVVPNDIPSLLNDLPTLKRVVFPKTSAEMFKKKQCFKNLLSTPASPTDAPFEFCVCTDGVASIETMKVFDTPNWIKAVVPVTTAQMKDAVTSNRSPRYVELVVLPSTSPANASINNALKEKIWHIGCFGCKDVPSLHYKCAACGETGTHWLIDCKNDGYDAWCRERKLNYRSSSVDPDVGGDRWLFSNPKNV